MTDSKALIERLREKISQGSFIDGLPYNPDGFEAADHIEKLEADKARLNDALRQAVIDAAEWARKAGEAQGKLEISEAAGILDGWIRDCEQLRADKALLRGALENIVNNCGQCGGYGTYPEEETVTGKVLWWDCSSLQCKAARAALQETSR